MSGQAGVFSPASVPVFDPAPIRGATRVRKQSGGGGGGMIEVPPVSFPGVIWSPSMALRSTIYSMPYIGGSQTVNEVTATLVQAPSAAGVKYQVLVNEVVKYTSIAMTGTWQLEEPFFPLEPYDQVYVRVSDHGSGNAAGLQVMIRFGPEAL